MAVVFAKLRYLTVRYPAVACPTLSEQQARSRLAQQGDKNDKPYACKLFCTCKVYAHQQVIVSQYRRVYSMPE